MISLAKYYYLVVGDRFELFYRGVVRAHDPYKYYIKATCDKGYIYSRYFTYTPKEDEVGSYVLNIAIYDDEGNILESKDTTLIVNSVKEVEPKTILCIGDSLTYNGVWPYVGFEKYSELFPGKLNFIGKMKRNGDKGEIGYEGYGGWQWKTFCSEYSKSHTSSVWVKCEHNLDESDQHSVWQSNNLEWVLESIEKDKLKFKRGNGNTLINPNLGETLVHVSHGTHTDEIKIDSFEYSEGNPFINPLTNELDFKYYLTKNNFKTPDYVFIFLSWNGQWIPYNKDFSIHNEYSKILLDKIHEAFPKALIGLFGIQLPCPNGGITACYGAHGPYHDWYGETITAMNYDEWLEELTYRDCYKDFMTYSDMKAQFDSEYNYHTKMMPVNNRSDITERIGVNGLHPSMNGYLQMGDAFYRFLVHMLNK